jgi:DNA polymerase-4
VVLRLRFGDFTRATRSHTLQQATAHTGTLLETARSLLRGVLSTVLDRGLTLLGVSLAELASDDGMQLALPFDQQSGPALDATLDALRARFGGEAVTRAARLGHDPGISVPMLPDT